ncbi:MAG: tetratricopeptide repeat protein [Burkholderiales bacterium]
MTRLAPFLWPCALVALAAALYLPFLGSPLVFDDRFFFSGRNFARYATTPFGLELRLPGYFTLAFVEVVAARIEAHRLVSLALHACVALALYKLVADLLRHAAPASPARLAAFGVAAAFALHPVAVYGAGYLIQRTGMLATLFSLLSLVFFFRGLRERRLADAATAALMYSIAVLSKETAVLVPAAALAGLYFLRPDRKLTFRYSAAYLAACVPAALLAVLLVKGKIGSAYEPDFAVVAAQVGAVESGSPWLLSATTQLELFFRYLGLWLWPHTGGMSIDIRVELGPDGLALKLAAFLAYAGACAFLLSRGGRAAMAGFGLLYVWLLYLVELTTVRFADPFVLYRSYLWAPGLAVALAASLSLLPARITMVALLLGLPMLAVQAHDRLQSFSSGLALWQDAAAKLPAQPVPGGSRTLYQLGREYFYGGDTDKAIATADRCIAEYPSTYDCYFARAAIHVELEQYGAALPFIARAAELRPESGSARHLLGFALESLGRLEEAKAQYRAALKLGFHGAVHRLKRLEDPGSGLLPPTRSEAPPPG